MAYTPFAILASVLILSFAMSQIGLNVDSPEPHRLGGVAESNIENTQNIYTLRSVQDIADIAETQEVNDFGEGVYNLTLYGSYKGSNIRESSLSRYFSSFEELSGGVKEVERTSFNFKVENLTFETYSEVKLVGDKMNYSVNSEGQGAIEDVSDPLLQRIGYTSQISSCSYSEPIEKFEGQDYSAAGTAHGEPVDAADMSSTSDFSRIVISQNITKYDNNTVADFAGYVSKAVPSSPSSYNDNYAINYTIPSFSTGQRIIIHDGAWKSNIYRAMNENCYIPTRHLSTPSVEDRIENRTQGSTAQGIYTVVNISANSSKSNIGYERVEAANSLVQFEGINRGDGENISFFRMNRSLAESGEFSSLIY